MDGPQQCLLMGETFAIVLFVVVGVAVVAAIWALVTIVTVVVVWLPTASLAVALIVCEPLLAFRLFHL